MIRRVFHHHDDWEDHRAGMFALSYGDEQGGTREAAELLGDPDLLWAAMSAVAREWPVAAEHNLSHTTQNRQAWLGQAACCFALGVPEFLTRLGWHTLTTAQQVAANAVADQVIAEWEAAAETEPCLFGEVV